MSSEPPLVIHLEHGLARGLSRDIELMFLANSELWTLHAFFVSAVSCELLSSMMSRSAVSGGVLIELLRTRLAT